MGSITRILGIFLLACQKYNCYTKNIKMRSVIEGGYLYIVDGDAGLPVVKISR